MYVTMKRVRLANPNNTRVFLRRVTGPLIVSFLDSYAAARIVSTCQAFYESIHATVTRSRFSCLMILIKQARVLKDKFSMPYSIRIRSNQMMEYEWLRNSTYVTLVKQLEFCYYNTDVAILGDVANTERGFYVDLGRFTNLRSLNINGMLPVGVLHGVSNTLTTLVWRMDDTDRRVESDMSSIFSCVPNLTSLCMRGWNGPIVRTDGTSMLPPNLQVLKLGRRYDQPLQCHPNTIRDTSERAIYADHVN
jgi:hypothetical protein